MYYINQKLILRYAFAKFNSLKKRQTSLDASREKASRALRKAGPIFPLHTSKHACGGAETPISGL